MLDRLLMMRFDSRQQSMRSLTLGCWNIRSFAIKDVTQTTRANSVAWAGGREIVVSTGCIWGELILCSATYGEAPVAF